MQSFTLIRQVIKSEAQVGQSIATVTETPDEIALPMTPSSMNAQAALAPAPIPIINLASSSSLTPSSAPSRGDSNGVSVPASASAPGPGQGHGQGQGQGHGVKAEGEGKKIKSQVVLNAEQALSRNRYDQKAWTVLLMTIEQQGETIPEEGDVNGSSG